MVASVKTYGFTASLELITTPLYLKQGRITKWDVVLSLPVEDWGDRARFLLIERKGQVMEIDVAEWLRRRGEKQERR